MKRIGVDCIFGSGGTVSVRRIEVDDLWRPVEQGRQWVDPRGRHVLVMLPGEEVREIVLQAETMSWVLLPKQGRDVKLV
ncbi:MAG: hypothetical protein ACWGPS_01270 [Candidatus Promineifilaceae bacterium]